MLLLLLLLLSPRLLQSVSLQIFYLRKLNFERLKLLKLCTFQLDDIYNPQDNSDAHIHTLLLLNDELAYLLF
jgi:hypothetical protein